ncbi:phage minor capsid protein [Halobacillus sp. A5]|uniref:phage minor capsid protein n=1 Tax=Halobacillus sp. A5 TaxID=2880263 RepID=UPI0020A6D1C2|nr:phage minor capsid protein [Halobacillus sp. A5]MCP3026612.1 phage minor capsid protein [Halobacillus sp. A5]
MNNDELLKYISNVVQDIIQKVAEAEELEKEDKAQALIEQIGSILDQFGVELEEIIPELAILNYFGGVDEATEWLNESGIEVEKTLALTSEGQVAKAFQRPIHMEALEEVVEETLLDFKAALRTAKNNSKVSINDALNSVKADIAEGLIRGNHNKVLSKKVMDSFSKNGLTSFTTVDGKKLPLDFYASTITKTKMRQASVKGSTNRYQENDVGLVIIQGTTPTCHICKKYQGMVVSLTGDHEGFPSTDDVPLPPYHPNCEDSARPYVIDYKSDEEVQAVKEKWANFNPEKDTRTPAQKKAYDKEQNIRRKANEEKKQFARYQMALGAEAPKTLGAFRRMKRQNSPKFQELQHQYKSIAQQASALS